MSPWNATRNLYSKLLRVWAVWPTTDVPSCFCSPCVFTSSGDGEVVEQVISQQTAEHEEAAVRRGSLLDQAIRQLQQQQDRQQVAEPEAGAGPEGQAGAQGPAPAPAPSTPRRGINTLPALHWIVQLAFWSEELSEAGCVLFFQINICYFPSLQCLWTTEQMCSLPLMWVCAAVDRWRVSGRCTRMLLAVRWPLRETCRPGDGGWWCLNYHPAATGKYIQYISI